MVFLRFLRFPFSRMTETGVPSPLWKTKQLGKPDQYQVFKLSKALDKVFSSMLSIKSGKKDFLEGMLLFNSYNLLFY